jgi:hypothetical protein
MGDKYRKNKINKDGKAYVREGPYLVPPLIFFNINFKFITIEDSIIICY